MPDATTTADPITIERVEQALERIYIAAEGATLRREDRKKAREVAALLAELPSPPRTSRRGEGPLLVDAAAGKGYVGLLAVELRGYTRLVVIERDPQRVAACAMVAARYGHAEVVARAGDVGDVALWPREPDVVVALHACGPAADRVIDAAVVSSARRLLLVPCCYGASVPFYAAASARAEAMGLPRHAPVRGRFVASLIDAERTLRLEAAGYETTVAPFVTPTITPHNLVWRARRVREPARMHAAATQLATLRGGGPTG